MAITPAERAVLLLMVQGFKSKEIARKLRRAEQTVRQQRWSMLHRTGCRTSGQLCYWAALSGYRASRAT